VYEYEKEIIDFFPNLIDWAEPPTEVVLDGTTTALAAGLELYVKREALSQVELGDLTIKRQLKRIGKS